MSSDPASIKVLAARDRYLVDSGYSVETYRDPRFKITIGKFVLTVPNPGKVHYHDLHHVVSGYSTGLVGEGEVSAYEIRGGSHSLPIFLLCAGAVAIGFVLSPRRIVRAFRAAKGSKTLYRSQIPYETLLEMELAELRCQLNISVEGFRN